MQYQVPQFIEVEDKMFGSLTLKQFLYVAGGGAIGFIIWSFLPMILAIIIGGPVVVFFLMAAFYRVNGRPFLHYFENYMKFMLSKKIYLWRKTEKKVDYSKFERVEAPPVSATPKLTQSKLQELTSKLDVHENLLEKTKDRL